ncbi:MAG: hypothetical protein JRE12_10500 [Deltaproteobacteria bacterium]|nr:hypothetical protein [Deltaproteobacteria bacterium]
MPPDKDQINTPLNPTEPQTVDEAADEIIETLDLEERVKISNLPSISRLPLANVISEKDRTAFFGMTWINFET